MRRSDWHVRAGSVVILWLAAAVVVAALCLLEPIPDWLPVHLLLLGALSNAILIWSNHFAAAVLRLPDRSRGRPEAVRLACFNGGALAVVAGMLTGWWAVVVVGAAVAAAAVAWHAVVLLRRKRSALPAPFGPTVRYYVAAGLLLPFGIAVGVVMAPGELTDQMHARLALAHVSINLLGWVGLTLVGTLVTFWPTMLRTQVAAGAERAARRALPVLLVGIGMVAVGALLGARSAAALGICCYVVGLALNARPIAETARRRPPTDYSTWSVLAAMAWMIVSVAALGVVLGTAPSWAAAAERADRLGLPLLMGFAAQLLLGALSYLIPVAMGGGPAAARATGAILNRGGTVRLVMINVGLVVAVLPLPHGVRVAGTVALLAALAAFLPLAVWAVVVARRSVPQVPGPDARTWGGRHPGTGGA